MAAADQSGREPRLQRDRRFGARRVRGRRAGGGGRKPDQDRREQALRRDSRCGVALQQASEGRPDGAIEMAGDLMDAKIEAKTETKTKPRPQQKPGDVIDGLLFPFADYPGPSEAIEVAEGIFWLSTPVPFVGLKQVNLWLIRDGDGWTMVDCSYGGKIQRELIEAAWARLLGGRPVKQLIVTHFHPDHAGGSGWIAEKWGLRPRMTHAEWLTANLAVLNRNTDHVQNRGVFYRRHGLDEARLQRFLSGVVLYSDGVTLPKSR